MSSEIARAKTRAMWKGSQIGGCSGLLASKERVVLASCAKRMNLKTFARGSDGIGKDARRVCGGSAAMGTTVHEAGALARGSRTAAQSDVPGSCRWIMPKLRIYNLQSNPTDLIFCDSWLSREFVFVDDVWPSGGSCSLNRAFGEPAI